MKVRIKTFNGELPDCFTVGKEYDVSWRDKCGARITTDNDCETIILFEDCNHLNGGSWEIVE